MSETLFVNTLPQMASIHDAPVVKANQTKLESCVVLSSSLVVVLWYSYVIHIEPKLEMFVCACVKHYTAIVILAVLIQLAIIAVTVIIAVI